VNFKLPKIYPITDVRLSGLSHTEQVKRLIAGGARFIQLREKFATPREFHDDAREAVRFARDHGCRIIINDRADIALAAGADGVHLGQDDLPPVFARKLLGNDFIIGFSTHSAAQAKAAAGLPVDYVALGPVFDTRTKINPDDTVGIEGLQEARRAAGGVPLVAIGGITAESLGAVYAAGADSAAVIGALVCNAEQISMRMKEMFDISGKL
jgi:thiamine-phosphate pyrophosphorylase